MTEDTLIFSEDLNRPMMSLEEKANEIADHIENGEMSPLFRTMLAEMIRPSGKHMDLVLHLAWKKPHEPKRTKWHVGAKMCQLVDDEKVSLDEAIYQIQKNFGEAGNRRSKCIEAMNQARRERAMAELIESWSK